MDLAAMPSEASVTPLHPARVKTSITSSVETQMSPRDSSPDFNVVDASVFRLYGLTARRNAEQDASSS